MIQFEQYLDSATNRWDNPIKVYDDGIGPLWVYRNSLGIVGIVRAQTWEDAYDTILDEILVPLSPEDVEEYAYDPDGGGNRERGELAEGHHYMANAGTSTGIVSTDLNGESLDELTPEMVADWDIKLVIRWHDDDSIVE